MTEQFSEDANTSGSLTGTGAPAESDLHEMTAGADGPIMLHDMHFVEQMAHFDRERVPERVVHAKGSGAFGVFEVTNDVSKYTKAAVFQPGEKTEVLLRFSQVAGEMGSPDTWRDPRGFAIKFYTREGNYDLVGNNTPIFFVRDAMKFPHFIRSQKRRADSGLRDNHMQWDFWTQAPESAHQVTYMMGDRGIPRTYRHMNGYGSHTFMWINASGEKFWVKYNFHSDQGVEGLSGEEALQIAGEDADAHRRDLFNAIENGDFPSWTLKVQVIPFEEGFNYRVNIFDVTKTVSHKDYPEIEVGKLTLNRNPENFFAQIEQAAFEPSAVVPGTGLSPDRMLLGRVFSYADTHRHRIGPNYLQLPVNRPRTEGHSYSYDGAMTYHYDKGAAKMAPNTEGTPFSVGTGEVADSIAVSGDLVRRAQTIRSEEDDDFTQPGIMVREVFDDDQRERFVRTVVGHLKGGVSGNVLERAFDYWKKVDQNIGERIEKEYHADDAGDNPGGQADDAAERIAEGGTKA